MFHNERAEHESYKWVRVFSYGAMRVASCLLRHVTTATERLNVAPRPNWHGSCLQSLRASFLRAATSVGALVCNCVRACVRVYELVRMMAN